MSDMSSSSGPQSFAELDGRLTRHVYCIMGGGSVGLGVVGVLQGLGIGVGFRAAHGVFELPDGRSYLTRGYVPRHVSAQSEIENRS